MNYEVFSHNEGLSLIDNSIKDQLFKLIEDTNIPIREGCANDLRKMILTRLKQIGWSEDFELDSNSRISLTSYFDSIVLCLQTGNMSRFYADLLKLQYVYKKKKATAGIYLIPSKLMAKTMGSNIAHFDRFTNELVLFKEIITIPMIIIGLK